MNLYRHYSKLKNKNFKLYTQYLAKERSVYKGELNLKSQRNGVGVLIYDDGRKYEGEWLNAMKNGLGEV